MITFKNVTINGEGVSDVDVAEVDMLRERLNLIDVRRPEEYTGELGHIEGTRLMTLETEFANGIKTVSTEKPIVFVCRSGGRSSKAAAYASALGIKDVYNMAGGMLEWNERKLPIIK